MAALPYLPPQRGFCAGNDSLSIDASRPLPLSLCYRLQYKVGSGVVLSASFMPSHTDNSEGISETARVLTNEIH